MVFIETLPDRLSRFALAARTPDPNWLELLDSAGKVSDDAEEEYAKEDDEMLIQLVKLRKHL